MSWPGVAPSDVPILPLCPTCGFRALHDDLDCKRSARAVYAFLAFAATCPSPPAESESRDLLMRVVRPVVDDMDTAALVARAVLGAGWRP